MTRSMPSIQRPTIAAILCLSASLASACSTTPDSLDSLIHAYEVAQSTDSIHDVMIRTHPRSDIVDAALARLNDQDDPVSPEAQDRLWRLLAKLPGVDTPTAITNPARVDALRDALVLGSPTTKLDVLQYAARKLDPAIHEGFFATLLEQIPLEPHASVLSSLLNTARIFRILDTDARTYVQGLVTDIQNVNPELRAKVNSQDPLTDVSESRQRSIRRAALALIIATEPDPNDALGWVLSRPDDDDAVAAAMRVVGISTPVMNEMTTAQKSAWIDEYARRYCLDASFEHRDRYSIFYLLYMFNHHTDIDPALCGAIDTIESNCGIGEPLKFQVVVDSVSARCD